MPISIISSLYRVEAHLPQFTQAVLRFAETVHQAGIDVRYMPIVNDATPTERSAIDTLTDAINQAQIGVMTPHYVGRETLYATWNRGLRLSDTPYITFWNADDVRDANAFIEGYCALQDGATLVDFRFTGVTPLKRLGLFPIERRVVSRMLYRAEKFTRKNGVGPFFMFHRDLYEQVGTFDENFKIAGDMEWAGRTLPYVTFYPAEQVGGYFYIHGSNLSNTGTNRESIEVNIIFLRRGDWYQLIPVDPSAMRDAWETWGNPADIRLPDEVSEYLWGASAEKRWRQFQTEHQQPDWIRQLRLKLASRGIVPSAEWAVYQRNQQG